jgi:hypothetical protein
MTTFAIYSYLFAATALYAVVLARYGWVLNPDWTWLQVVAGTVLCLLAPYLDQRYNGPLTSELYEHRVWMAFLVGGFPIVVWQISQSARAHLRVERRILRKHGDTTDYTAPRPQNANASRTQTIDLARAIRALVNEAREKVGKRDHRRSSSAILRILPRTPVTLSA